MKFTRIVGDPVDELIASTKAEAHADELSAAAHPFAERFCASVSVAVIAYVVFQLARAAAQHSFGWVL